MEYSIQYAVYPLPTSPITSFSLCWLACQCLSIIANALELAHFAFPLALPIMASASYVSGQMRAISELFTWTKIKQNGD